MPADRGRYPPPAVAIPSPPAGSLVPGLPLPQARRSWEITPPARLWLNARRWLKPAGSPLTHARRPPLTLAPWIQSTRHGQESRVCVLLCPQEHFNQVLSVLSLETRLGQAAPCFVAAEAIPATCLPVVDMEVVGGGPCKGPWLLVMPRGSLSFQANPGGLLVPVGCPVLFVWPWRVLLSCHVLSCPVCLAPEGSWYPLTSPGKFWDGVEGFRLEWPGRETGPRPWKTTCHGLLSSLHHHGLLSSLHLPWPPELPAPPWPPELPASPWPPLSVPLWRSCVPVRVCPEGPPERPPPLPYQQMVYFKIPVSTCSDCKIISKSHNTGQMYQGAVS